MITGGTVVAGVIGHPVAHSLSPALHNAAFAALGLDWVYVAFDVGPGDAPAALDAVVALGLRGLSVTMPHKEPIAAAIAARGRLDPAATALRSVNTVVVGSDGALEGYSTDGPGLVASLRAAGIEVAGARVCLLGAGGAARAIADALAREGVASLAVRNRTRSAADATAAIAAAHGTAVAVVAPDDDAPVADADIVVNATSVGMGVQFADGASADDAGRMALVVDPAAFSARQVVVDIVYHPRRTVLLAAAERAGARIIDGLGMLVHQAALQQVLWHGHMPDTAVMAAAAEQVLAGRALESRRQ